VRLLAIADNHFYHKEIIKHCNRPFQDYDEMNAHMIKKWNAVVQSEDRVIIVGDFFWSKAGKEKFDDLLAELNGVKGLILGNHDGWSKSFYLSKFTFVADRLDWNQFIFTHYPLKKIPHGKINIHGHTHQYHQRCGREIKAITKKWDCDRVCVSVEAIDYEPVVIWKGKSNVSQTTSGTTS